MTTLNRDTPFPKAEMLPRVTSLLQLLMNILRSNPDPSLFALITALFEQLQTLVLMNEQHVPLEMMVLYANNIVFYLQTYYQQRFGQPASAQSPSMAFPTPIEPVSSGVTPAFEPTPPVIAVPTPIEPRPVAPKPAVSKFARVLDSPAFIPKPSSPPPPPPPPLQRIPLPVRPKRILPICEPECIVCMDNRKEVALEPCNHKICCKGCITDWVATTRKKTSQNEVTCPLCRSVITGPQSIL